MQYLLLIYDAESNWETMPEEERNRVLEDYGAFSKEIRESGVFVAAERLQPTSLATTVSIRNGEQLTTDGPFAETKEQLGGFYLIDVESIDEAIEWATRIPSARFGRVEVRPIMPVPARVGQG